MRSVISSGSCLDGDCNKMITSSVLETGVINFMQNTDTNICDVSDMSPGWISELTADENCVYLKVIRLDYFG